MQTQNVHGHEVIDLIGSDSRGVTVRTLLRLVDERFGPDPRFHTCSDQGMSLGQLLAFLIRHGKVYEHEGRLCVDRSKVCNGEGHSHDHPASVG